MFRVVARAVRALERALGRVLGRAAVRALERAAARVPARKSVGSSRASVRYANFTLLVASCVCALARVVAHKKRQKRNEANAPTYIAPRKVRETIKAFRGMQMIACTEWSCSPHSCCWRRSICLGRGTVTVVLLQCCCRAAAMLL